MSDKDKYKGQAFIGSPVKVEHEQNGKAKDTEMSAVR